MLLNISVDSEIVKTLVDRLTDPRGLSLIDRCDPLNPTKGK